MTPQQKLDALIDLFTPEIKAAFTAAIQDVVDNTVLSQVIAAIESGDAVAAFQALGFSAAAMRPISAAIEKAFETGGVMTGQTFPKYLNTASGRGVFRFDVRNSRAEAWLRNQSSTLITRLTDDAMVTVRNTLTVGMQDGRNPRNVALDIVGRLDPATGHRSGGVVGLAQNQEYWVRSAQTKLQQLDNSYFNLALRDKRFDGTVANAIANNTALPSDTVDKLVARYKDNALQFRGETIGRTEAMQALNASEYEATNQAVDMGAVAAKNVKREWDSAGDARVRESHALLDGTQVGLNEPFVSVETGAFLMYPGDTSLGAPAEEVIRCRCRVRSRIDWLADVD